MQKTERWWAKQQWQKRGRDTDPQGPVYFGLFCSAEHLAFELNLVCWRVIAKLQWDSHRAKAGTACGSVLRQTTPTEFSSKAAVLPADGDPVWRAAHQLLFVTLLHLIPTKQRDNNTFALLFIVCFHVSFLWFCFYSFPNYEQLWNLRHHGHWFDIQNKQPVKRKHSFTGQFLPRLSHATVLRSTISQQKVTHFAAGTLRSHCFHLWSARRCWQEISFVDRATWSCSILMRPIHRNVSHRRNCDRSPRPFQVTLRNNDQTCCPLLDCSWPNFSPLACAESFRCVRLYSSAAFSAVILAKMKEGIYSDKTFCIFNLNQAWEFESVFVLLFGFRGSTNTLGNQTELVFFPWQNILMQHCV